MKALATIVILVAAQCASADDELKLKEEVLDFGPVHESNCEPTQDFRRIGSREGSYFEHIVQTNYRYSSGCRATSGIASLYKQEGDRYRKIWSLSASDPGVALRLSMKQHGEFLVLVFDFSDGGNGNISHQTAYIVDKDENVVPLDESAVHDWAEKQLLPEQRIHSSYRVNYSSSPINYHTRVMRTGDHRHATPQTSLFVEAEITNDDSSYKLTVTNAFNVGKSNYHNDQGLIAYRGRDFATAILRFQKSITAFPRNWQAHTNLGLAYLKAGEYDLSIKASTVVLNSDDAEDRSKANASFNIGLAYEAGEALDEALRYYVQANQLSPSRMRRDAITRLEDRSTE